MEVLSVLITSNWWIACLLIGLVLLPILLMWWLRRRGPDLPEQEAGGVMEPLSEKEPDPDEAGTAQVLNQFFGVPASLPREPHDAPSRLTAHPLAQIIANARGEKLHDVVPPVVKKEPVPPPAEAAREGRHEIADVNPLREKLAAREAELQRVLVELAGMTSRFKALDKESFIYTAHNKQLEAEIAALRAGLVPPDAPSKEDLDALQNELKASRESLRQAQVENKELGRQLGEKARAVEAGAAELATMRLDLAAAEDLLRAAEAPVSPPVEPAVARLPDAPAAGDASQTGNETESLRSENEDLRIEIAELKAAQALPEITSDTPGLSREAAALVQERDRLRNQVRTLQKSLGDASGFVTGGCEVDDLTRIKGIAKVISGRLNDHGVFTYRQIALWNEDDMKAFSELLAFKNRIWRDEWQAQARRLHAEKHGTALPEA